MSQSIELDPRLFERDIRITIIKAESKRELKNETYQLNHNLVCRVDSRDEDMVLDFLAPIAQLRQHNIDSRTDWIESVAEQIDSKFTFEREVPDHQVKLKVGGKILAAYENVELTTFQFSPKQTMLTFHLIARGTDGATVGKVAELMHANLLAEFKRAKHWSAQEDLDVDESGEQQEDALTPAQKKKIERAKEVANQANNEKVGKERAEA